MENENVVNTAEHTIKSIIAAAKDGKISDHEVTNEYESWKIPALGSTFKVKVTNRTSKTDKAFNKADLFEILPDREKRVNLGDWKKKLFYTLVYTLQGNKVFHKIQQDPSKVKAILADMKANPDNYSRTNDLIQGVYNGKKIQVSRVKKTFESGKELYRVTLHEAGVETLKGSQLMVLFK